MANKHPHIPREPSRYAGAGAAPAEFPPFITSRRRKSLPVPSEAPAVARPQALHAPRKAILTAAAAQRVC